MSTETKFTPAPVVPKATGKAMFYNQADGRRLIGFWAGGPFDEYIHDIGAPALTHPSEHVDPSWTRDEREKVAAALDAAPVLVTYRGSAHNRLAADPRCLGSSDRGIPGSSDRGIPGWRFPEGLAYYVREHGVRPCAEFVDALLAWYGLTYAPSAPAAEHRNTTMSTHTRIRITVRASLLQGTVAVGDRKDTILHYALDDIPEHVHAAIKEQLDKLAFDGDIKLTCMGVPCVSPKPGNLVVRALTPKDGEVAFGGRVERITSADTSSGRVYVGLSDGVYYAPTDGQYTLYQLDALPWAPPAPAPAPEAPQPTKGDHADQQAELMVCARNLLRAQGGLGLTLRSFSTLARLGDKWALELLAEQGLRLAD